MDINNLIKQQKEERKETFVRDMRIPLTDKQMQERWPTLEQLHTYEDQLAKQYAEDVW